MRHSILLRTITIVTAATMVFFIVGFVALRGSSLNALRTETVTQAADKLALFQTYLNSQITSANEYLYQFMIGIENQQGDAEKTAAFFEQCKPQNTLFASRILMFDDQIIAVDAPNKLWEMVADPVFYGNMSREKRLRISEPYYSSLCSARTIAFSSGRTIRSHEVTLICEIKTTTLFENLNNRLGSSETLIVLSNAGNTVYFDKETTLLTGRTALGSMIDIDGNTRNTVMSLPTGMAEVNYNGQDLIAETCKFDGRWILSVLMNKEAFYTAVNNLEKQYFLFGIPAAILLIAVCIAVSTSITGPVKKLTKQIDDQTGDLENMNIVCRSKDEVGRLADSFNHLLQRLKQAGKEKEEIERKNYRMEYKMLQSQIQPHFLFNVHMCIDSLLEQGETERARKMLTSLDLLLHNSTDKMQSLITIEQEIAMLSQYVDLQKERMGNSFEVDYGNWEPYRSIMVPKLLLQPLLENSLRHGLNGIAWPGRISLRFEEIDQQLHIFVEDNGQGIPEEELRRIEQGMEFNSEKNGMVSIGLSNVRDRIRVVYGENCGLYVSSRPNMGTTVEMVINMTI